MPFIRVQTHEKTIPLLGWPTDTVSIEWTHQEATLDDVANPTNLQPHTIILFVPGNPGLVPWYIPMLTSMIHQLGPGYVAHGASHAGHSTKTSHIFVGDESKVKSESNASNVAWTMEGQIAHKTAFVDHVLEQYLLDSDMDDSSSRQRPDMQLIFVSHSIGCYFTQQLCLLQPDIVQRTRLWIQLMPFICMQAPWPTQRLLDAVAAYPQATIAASKLGMQLLGLLPTFIVDRILQESMSDADSRTIAVQLVRQPAFAHNFFELGSREIKQVPRGGYRGEPA